MSATFSAFNVTPESDVLILVFILLPTNSYLFKLNNRNTRKRSEISSKIIINSPVVDLILVSLLLTLNRFHTLFWCFNCFEQVNVG